MYFVRCTLRILIENLVVVLWPFNSLTCPLHKRHHSIQTLTKVIEFTSSHSVIKSILIFYCHLCPIFSMACLAFRFLYLVSGRCCIWFSVEGRRYCSISPRLFFRETSSLSFRTYFLLAADAEVLMQFKMYVFLSFRIQSMLFNDAFWVSTGSDVDGQLVGYK